MTNPAVIQYMRSRVIVNVAMEKKEWRKDAMVRRLMDFDTTRAKTHAPDKVGTNLYNF